MKLSARGRTVLARVSKTRDCEVTHALPGEPDTQTVRTEYALLSDGVIGVKHTFIGPDGKVSSNTGWKGEGKAEA